MLVLAMRVWDDSVALNRAAATEIAVATPAAPQNGASRWQRYSRVRDADLLTSKSARLAHSLSRFATSSARATNKLSVGFPEAPPDPATLLEPALRAAREAVAIYEELDDARLAKAYLHLGMVHHNVYRSAPGYAFGAADGPAHGADGDECLKNYRNSVATFKRYRLADEHEDYPEALTCCGAQLDDRGQPQNSLQYRLHAAVARQLVSGKDHPLTIKYRTR